VCQSYFLHPKINAGNIYALMQGNPWITAPSSIWLIFFHGSFLCVCLKVKCTLILRHSTPPLSSCATYNLGWSSDEFIRPTSLVGMRLHLFFGQTATNHIAKALLLLPVTSSDHLRSIIQFIDMTADYRIRLCGFGWAGEGQNESKLDKSGIGYMLT
jgi:hypothetical protein